MMMLAGLCGCAGSHIEQNTVFIESGATARVATDKPMPVTVKDAAGKDHVENRNIGGMIVMPKSVYDEVRRGYLAASTRPDPAQIAPVQPPAPKAERLSPVELVPPNTSQK